MREPANTTRARNNRGYLHTKLVASSMLPDPEYAA